MSINDSVIVHPKGDPDRPLPNPGTTKDDHRRHYTPYLLLRSQAGDVGQRPLAAGDVFWESPDVWTEGSLGINQPVAGEPTRVFARISNLGLQDATGVTVKFWWANPSITITEQTAHLIASGNTAILSNNSVVFRSPQDWVPVSENGGHECLIVEAYIPAFDPLADPMLPSLDRHVGQKNESVLLLQAGQAFEFRLAAYNFTIERQHVAVEGRRGVIPRDFSKRFARKAGWPAELLDPMFALPVAFELSRHGHSVLPASRRGRARVFAEAAGGGAAAKSDCLAPALVSQSQIFEPGELRHLSVTGRLPVAARPGEVHVLRITQRIGPVVTGGYTLYLTLDPRHKG